MARQLQQAERKALGDGAPAVLAVDAPAPARDAPDSPSVARVAQSLPSTPRPARDDPRRADRLLFFESHIAELTASLQVHCVFHLWSRETEAVLTRNGSRAHAQDKSRIIQQLLLRDKSGADIVATVQLASQRSRQLPSRTPPATPEVLLEINRKLQEVQCPCQR